MDVGGILVGCAALGAPPGGQEGQAGRGWGLVIGKNNEKDRMGGRGKKRNPHKIGGRRCKGAKTQGQNFLGRTEAREILRMDVRGFL